MAEVRFDRFHTYEELTEILHAWAKEHSNLVSVESIGQSHEGRDIWLCTATNAETGPHGEKPALWVEANIHATEITGSVAALHLIHRLIGGYGSDTKVTRALDTRTFYVVPRLNPDGVEAALSERPRYVRSSTRPYPLPEEQDGLHREDVDGDGRILTMRVADPNGAWKIHHDEPRLMIRRDPDEDEPSIKYYRLLPEGTLRNYDGVMVKVAPPYEGLDLNRNFPADWEPEGKQKGAGPYPASEPEIRAEIQAVVDRPNICAYLGYHTFSGVHLRSYGDRPDTDFPTPDLKTFRWIGEEASRLTGYPAVSIYEGFRYDEKRGVRGGSIDWFYDHLGVYAWVTELWNPMKQAGLEGFDFIGWFQDHPVEDDVKLLAWNDTALRGRGFVEWYPFEHPQLGAVELGGWDGLRCWGNPPLELMQAEVEPHAAFAVFLASISPLLAFRSVSTEALGSGKHLVRVAIENRGWLPTNVSDKALERKIVRPVEAEIALPDGAKLISGPKRIELGQLTGRADKRTMYGYYRSDDSTTDRAGAEWVVEAPSGSTISVTATHARAGVARAEVTVA